MEVVSFCLVKWAAMEGCKRECLAVHDEVVVEWRFCGS